MNEDFVSFDLAKKLKDKGFNCEYPFAMYDKYEQFCPLYSSDKYYFGIDGFDKHACIAPTISQVLKWLREEKVLFVEVSANNYTAFDFYFTIYEKGEECWIVCGFDEEYHDTYEAAALAGIEYVIDNLI